MAQISTCHRKYFPCMNPCNSIIFLRHIKQSWWDNLLPNVERSTILTVAGWGWKFTRAVGDPLTIC